MPVAVDHAGVTDEILRAISAWIRSPNPTRHCEEHLRRSNPVFVSRSQSWIASRSLSSGAHSRDPLARNDGKNSVRVATAMICESRKRLQPWRRGSSLGLSPAPRLVSSDSRQFDPYSYARCALMLRRYNSRAIRRHEHCLRQHCLREHCVREHCLTQDGAGFDIQERDR